MTFPSFFKDISLIVYDCDGVLTDNRVIVDQEGKEYATFSRSDGMGISLIKDKLQIPQIVISTETNPIVVKRCQKLNIGVMNSVSNKKETLEKYCDTFGIDLKCVFFIGNDINDIEAMKTSGYSGCPADAEPEVLAISDWISTKNGGYGVVRELSRLLIDSRLTL